MEDTKLEAKATQADSTEANMLTKAADALRGHKGIVAATGAVLVAGAIP